MEHQSSRLLKTQALLILERTQGCNGFEVVMQARLAHADLLGDGLDAGRGRHSGV